MKTTEIRKLSDKEINSRIYDLKEELFNLKFKAALGQLEQTHRIKEVRKTIAKLKTIQSENERNT